MLRAIEKLRSFVINGQLRQPQLGQKQLFTTWAAAAAESVVFGLNIEIGP